MSFGKAADLLKLAMLATRRAGICLAEVEEEFGCVRRTAQRMIQALQVVFPAIEHAIGEDGRHYWHLPSRAVAALLSPAVDELVALSAAVTEMERAGATSEAVSLRALDAKVRALIPKESRGRLATDEEAVLEAMGFAARPGPRPAFNSTVDEAISAALKGPLCLSIRYQSRTDAEPSWRAIEPLGLLLGSRRYLVGVDVAKRDGRLRHYRVEDITDARVETNSFVYPEGFDLQIYAQRAFGSFHNEAEYGETVWRFAPEAAERASRYEFHPGQQIERMADGSLEVRFAASGHLEMAWHLYSWGTAVEVVEPDSLAERVHPYRRSDFPALP